MTKNKTGKVYLVGAGPGDPDLITLKGKSLLQSCDAVVYDNLIPLELLVALPEETEKYYVGKKAGRHTLPQEEINVLMVKLAREGKDVVRLKGGDPIVFGRGGEEAEFLRENDIKYEIVPGVTAGVAGPAYSGIPVTERNQSSFVMFLTGHKADEKELTSVPWEWVARAENGTLVVYMGVNEIEEITARLLKAGMAPDMPVAVIERGTFPTQRTIIANVKQLPEKVKDANINPPAIFVFGKVVNLHQTLKWFEDRPLFGLRVMVTRPARQAEDFYKKLRQLGVEPLPYPTIITNEFVDYAGWDNFQKINTDALWLVFTSENGVHFFMKQHRERIGDIRRLGAFKIAAVGEGTSKELAAHGLTADFIPSEATVACLAGEMTAKFNLKQAVIMRVQGNLADDTAEKILAAAGATVRPLTVYETADAVWLEGLKEKLVAYPPDVVVFTSGSTVKSLCRILSEDTDCKKLIEKCKKVSIGPSTSQVIRSYGMEVTLEAVTHTVDGIIDELLKYYEKNPFTREK
ncbi:MAG: uroporphyrinogen-III C-methyltransferase [candidate division Zixibacteria bacterium]|nr:uroporphyrinogen-III C-methyltransferase [candidate division Zixibacteria bacterium]